MNRFTDANYLYDAGTKAMKGSHFKKRTHLFEMTQLLSVAHLQKDILEGTYKPQHGHRFKINERGKERSIASNTVPDKAINHIMCDEILTPAISRIVAYDNSASQKGKGVSFHRKRVVVHLRHYYATHGTNDGYVLLVDFSKYYASIPHFNSYEIMEKLIRRYEEDPEETETALWILQRIFKSFGGDQGVDIGNQCSQDIGISYPYRIDDYVKIIRRIKSYARYTDDFYLISDSKEELLSVLAGMHETASELGLTINEKKTRICKLSDHFRHLQIQYSLTDTGRIIHKISPKSITRERRKLKAYKRLLDKGVMTYDDIENCFKSWIGGHWKYMSREQIHNMSSLYKELFGRSITWKKGHGRLRWLMAQ